MAQSLVGANQDPDALFNAAFFELARESSQIQSLFVQPRSYPGRTTKLTFANGSHYESPNLAIILSSLDGISNGDDAYSAFFAPSATSSAVATTNPTSGPTIPGYPHPVAESPDGIISGYFLNGTGLEDVAVLVIFSFEPPQVTADTQRQFQQTLQDFLTSASSAGKKKLVIDLQTNGGGLTNLGSEAFAQLFRSMRPNSQGNELANAALNAIGITASNIFAGDLATGNYTAQEQDMNPPVVVQGQMTLDQKPFASWSAFYGPVEVHGAEFTNLFQTNYSDPLVTDDYSSGLIITGTNNRTNIGPGQVFEPSNMVLLYDGQCASTCAFFSELMKTLGGVQAVAVGGRPQQIPMQGGKYR